MLHDSFEDVGIPPGYGFKQLLYCPAANVLVVQTQSWSNSWRPERLYFRDIGAPRYTAIGTPTDLVSQEFPVVAISRPLLAYQSNVHTLELDGQGIERHGASWKSVTVFDLKARNELDVIDTQLVRFPEGVSDAWISSLLSFGESGDILHVVAALSRDGRLSFEYQVAELDLKTRVVRPLATLPAVFM
jgi:hypothetical protein